MNRQRPSEFSGAAVIFLTAALAVSCAVTATPIDAPDGLVRRRGFGFDG